MKKCISLLIVSIFLVIGLVCDLAYALVAPTHSETTKSHLKIIKRWNESAGGCDIFWADGLAVVSDAGRRITRLDNNGHVLSVINSEWIIRPYSIQCNDAVVIGQFLLSSSDIKNPDSTLGFPAMIDLQSGKHTKIASGDKLSLFLNITGCCCEFWGPHQNILLGRLPHSLDKYEQRLALVKETPQNLTEWTPPNGGHPSSWMWSNDPEQTGFWVLTDHPGYLYFIGKPDQAGIRIPALDEATVVMLSPNLKSAVAFHKGHQDGYWVDISQPEFARPLRFDGITDAKSLILGYGIWSPDGTQVALLLASNASNAPYELYIGNPAEPLKKADMGQFHFPDSNWMEKGEPTGLPGYGSIVWDSNSRCIYCRMIDSKSHNQGQVEYVIGRYAL